MSSKPSFFSELRRRNVFRVALTYAVVAWLLIEIASVVLPMVDAPESIITAFVVLLALGFAVALFISWSFEMTPEGLKRTQDLSPDEVIPNLRRLQYGMTSSGERSCVRFKPSGVISKDHEIKSATAKPRASNMTNAVIIDWGASSIGKTTDAISSSSQATTA